MKLLILTCLVAVALARPKFSSRHPESNKNELDSNEKIFRERKFPRFVSPTQREIREEYNNELIRKELLREKENDEFKQQKASSSSSSEESIPNNTEKHIPQEELYSLNLEQILKRNKYEQLQLEAVRAQGEPMRVVNQEQAHFYREPFQQFYQLDVYPYAAWYYPQQVMPFMTLPIHEIPKPIAFENTETTDTVSSD